METSILGNRQILSCIVVLLFLLLAGTCSAVELTLESEKDIYSINDQVEIYLVTSEVTEDTYLFIESDLKHTDDIFIDFIEEKEVNLIPGEENRILLRTLYIDESIPQGLYSTSVTVSGDVTWSDTIYFEIEYEKTEVLPIEIQLCKDPECKEISNVFFNNDSLFVKINTLSTANITVKIIHPDGKESNIQPESPFNLEDLDPGIYSVNVEGEAFGYLKSKISEPFSIVKRTEIPTLTTICNADGICNPENGENNHNCPLDCEKETDYQYPIFIWILPFILVLVIAFIILLLKKIK